MRWLSQGWAFDPNEANESYLHEEGVVRDYGREWVKLFFLCEWCMPAAAIDHLYYLALRSCVRITPTQNQISSWGRIERFWDKYDDEVCILGSDLPETLGHLSYSYRLGSLEVYSEVEVSVQEFELRVSLEVHTRGKEGKIRKQERAEGEVELSCGHKKGLRNPVGTTTISCCKKTLSWLSTAYI